MDTEQKIQKTLDGKSGASASVLCPNVEGLSCFRLIRLTGGKYAIVDTEDYAEINKHKWRTQKTRTTYYAVRDICLNYPRQTILVYMHRQIMQPLKDEIIHHDGGFGLDNRKKFLTICKNPNEHKNKFHKN